MTAPTRNSEAAIKPATVAAPPNDRPASPVHPTGGSIFTRAPAASTRTLIGAIELGILGDYLMRVGVGVNVTVWVWALLVTSLAVMAGSDAVLDRRRMLLLGATAFFAAVPAWRSTEEIVLFSGLAVVTLLVLTAWTATAPDLALARQAIGTYARAALTGALHIIAGAIPLLFAEAQSRAERHSARRRSVNAALRGLALSVPVVFIFGALLMNADAGYEALVNSLFRWDAGTVVSHAMLAGVFTWLAAAYLCASMCWGSTESTPPLGLRLGVVEGGMVLGVVNLLFLSFIIVQVGYLFGGAQHVLETAGLTYAEYARRGFFELVTVTALALPLLVGVTSAVRPETPREHRVHRALATALTVLLLALVVSALGRMRLYQVEYGWTLPRVHATALILWLSGCIAWFAATVLRGDPRRFAFGSLAGGLGVLAALVLVNPADLIVRANAARVADGRDFDAEHAAWLGADAVPALIAVLPTVGPTLDAKEKCTIQSILRDNRGSRSTGADESDWRVWSLAKSRARSAARDAEPRLAAVLGTAPCEGLTKATGGEAPTPPPGDASTEPLSGTPTP